MKGKRSQTAQQQSNQKTAEDALEAITGLFQTYLDVEITAVEEEVPEDPYLGPIHIIKSYYESLYRHQKHKVQKARLEEILKESKGKSPVEKLLREATTLEEKEDATVEEVFSMPITSEALLQRLQDFEHDELIMERTRQLEEITNITPDEFVTYFTFDDLVEVEAMTENKSLKMKLRSCISAHKRVIQITKRNQYLTEKLCHEVEKQLDGSPMSTPEIQAFRAKAAQLSIVHQSQIDAPKIQEFLASTTRYDQKVVSLMKERLANLERCQQDFFRVRNLPISQDKLGEVEKLHHALRSENLYIRELFEMATQYHYFSIFVFKWHSLFFVQKYQFDDVVSQLLENEINIPESANRLKYCITTLKDLLEQQVPHIIGSHEPPTPHLIQKFRTTLWRCQVEYLTMEMKQNKVDPNLLMELVSFGEPPQHIVELQQAAKAWLHDYDSLMSHPIEQTLNHVLDSAQDYRQLRNQIIRMLKTGTDSPLDLSARLNTLTKVYLQLVWVYKAANMLKKKPLPTALRTLQTYADLLTIPEETILRKQVDQRLSLYDTVQEQLQEYVQQRAVWKNQQSRECLKTFRQQLLYINAKPSYLKAQQIAENAKLLTLTTANLQTLLVDLRYVDEMISIFTTGSSVLNEIRRMMLNSFLRVDFLTSLIFYYLIKQSLMKAYADQDSLTAIQTKMDDFKLLLTKETWLNQCLSKTLEFSSLPSFVQQFYERESFQWIQTIQEALEVDMLAHSLKERLPEAWERVRELEREGMTDLERLELREKHLVDFQELEEFILNKMSRVKLQQDLAYLVTHYEAGRKVLMMFIEMVDQLKEFNLKFELEKLEMLIDQYLEGGIAVYIKEMGQLVQYATMAKALWAEVLDQQDIMRQPLLDKKMHRNVNEFMTKFVEAQKKFNVEVPDVKRFAEEYYETMRRISSVQNQLSSVPKDNLRQTLLRDLPPHMRCLEELQECHLELWMGIVEEFLGANQIVWSFTRLFSEITEGYKLLELVVCKHSPMNIEELSQLESELERFKQLLIQLESLYEEVELYLQLDNPDFTKPYENKITLQEPSNIQFLLRKPFTDFPNFVDKIRVRYLSKSRGTLRKRDPKQLRIRTRQIKSVSKYIKSEVIAKQNIPLQKESKKIKKVRNVQIPLLAKKSSTTQSDVTESLRIDKRHQLISQIKQNPVFKKESAEQRVKVIESHIFGDHHASRQQYEIQMESIRKFFQVIEPLRYFSKRLRRREQHNSSCTDRFEFSEIVRHANRLETLPKLEAELARKFGKVSAGPKLLQINLLKTKAPRKQQRRLVDMIIKQQQRAVQQYPQLVPQQVRRDEDLEVTKKVRLEESPSPILYNPETGKLNREVISDVRSLGTLTIRLKKDDSLRKRAPSIRPQMLSMDEDDSIILFPERLLSQIQIHQKASCPVTQVTEYVSGHKLKIVKGWLYASNLEEAHELEKLALIMREQKISIGTRCYENLIGVSLVHIDHIHIKPKWIVPNQLAADPNYLSQLDTYEKIHLLKPQIGFYLYIKDFSSYVKLCESNQEQPGGLKGVPMNYTSVYKIQHINQLITTYRDYQRSTRELNKTPSTPLQWQSIPEYIDQPFQPRTPSYREMYQNRNSYEPISDDDSIHITNEHKQTALNMLNRQRENISQSQDIGLQSMILREIPNILNLLKNDDEGEQD